VDFENTTPYPLTVHTVAPGHRAGCRSAAVALQSRNGCRGGKIVGRPEGCVGVAGHACAPIRDQQ
jgi:hypothetical protein